MRQSLQSMTLRCFGFSATIKAVCALVGRAKLPPAVKSTRVAGGFFIAIVGSRVQWRFFGLVCANCCDSVPPAALHNMTTARHHRSMFAAIGWSPVAGNFQLPLRDSRARRLFATFAKRVIGSLGRGRNRYTVGPGLRCRQSSL